MSDVTAEREFAPVQEREEPESEKKALITVFGVVIIVVIVGVVVWLSPFFIPYWEFMGVAWLWGYIPISLFVTVLIIMAVRESISHRIHKKAQGRFLSLDIGNSGEEEWSETFRVNWIVEIDFNKHGYEQLTSEQRRVIDEYDIALEKIRQTSQYNDLKRKLTAKSREPTESRWREMLKLTRRDTSD